MARLVLVEEEKLPKAKLTLAPEAKPMPAGEVATSALINAPRSLFGQIAGAGEAIMHPIDTAQNILNLGAGELSKVLPTPVNEYLNKLDEQILGKQRAEQLHQRQTQSADVMNQIYGKRYGTMEGFKETLAQDPFAIVGDVSTALGLGGGVLKTAGAAGKAPVLSKVGQVATRASEVTNPLLPAQKLAGLGLKGIGKTAAEIQGGFTGTGAAPIEEAYAAGKYNKPEFWANLTGSGDVTDVVESAKTGVLALKQNKNAQYKSGMLDISKDKTTLDFGDIDKAISDAFDKTKYKGQVTKEAAYKKVAEAQDEVNKWKNLDPAEYHTPEGIDALKQKLGDIMESVPYEQSNVRNALGGIYSATKQTISKQAPTYGKVMKDYEKASELIRDVERGLSLKSKSTADSALRKLQSVMRNNVQTNYGERIKMVQELEKAGGKEIMPALAGQSLNPWLARGMVGQIERAGGLAGAILNPLATVVGGTLASPKITGATAYGLGKVASIKDKIARNIPLTAEEMRQATLLGLQANQPQGLLGQ